MFKRICATLFVIVMALQLSACSLLKLSVSHGKDSDGGLETFSTEDIDNFETLEFSGHGPGHIKDINLPYGEYNIILTHSGSSNFIVFLNEELIANEIGVVSYVHRLKPGSSMGYEVGTPLEHGYINITNANGEWTITIEKLD